MNLTMAGSVPEPWGLAHLFILDQTSLHSSRIDHRLEKVTYVESNNINGGWFLRTIYSIF